MQDQLSRALATTGIIQPEDFAIQSATSNANMNQAIQRNNAGFINTPIGSPCNSTQVPYSIRLFVQDGSMSLNVVIITQEFRKDVHEELTIQDCLDPQMKHINQHLGMTTTRDLDSVAVLLQTTTDMDPRKDNTNLFIHGTSKNGTIIIPGQAAFSLFKMVLENENGNFLENELQQLKKSKTRFHFEPLQVDGCSRLIGVEKSVPTHEFKLYEHNGMTVSLKTSLDNKAALKMTLAYCYSLSGELLFEMNVAPKLLQQIAKNFFSLPSSVVQHLMDGLPLSDPPIIPEMHFDLSMLPEQVATEPMPIPNPIPEPPPPPPQLPELSPELQQQFLAQYARIVFESQARHFQPLQQEGPRSNQKESSAMYAIPPPPTPLPFGTELTITRLANNNKRSYNGANRGKKQKVQM